jgi:hypothetical protein
MISTFTIAQQRCLRDLQDLTLSIPLAFITPPHGWGWAWLRRRSVSLGFTAMAGLQWLALESWGC